MAMTLAGLIISGASLVGTSVEAISAANATNRNCTVKITNCSEATLKEPRWCCTSGDVRDPLEFYIGGRTSEVAIFSKIPSGWAGSAFVFSYLLDNDHRVAIMGSVPGDQCSYENWFGAKFMNPSSETNADLFNQMYYECPENNDVFKIERTRAGKPIMVRKGGWNVSVTMSDSCNAIMEVTIWKN